MSGRQEESAQRQHFEGPEPLKRVHWYMGAAWKILAIVVELWNLETWEVRQAVKEDCCTYLQWVTKNFAQSSIHKYSKTKSLLLISGPLNFIRQRYEG